MKKRLNLLDLHKTEIKKHLMGNVKGGGDIRCLCTFTNPLVSTRETGGTVALCICSNTLGNSVTIQTKANT